MADWTVGQTVLDGYLIEKELGRGGMGCVWLVKSNSTGHRFAVKQALLKEDKHRKAFMDELLTWVDLPDHPNLVPCCFFRTVEDEVVIFAEYVAGGSLKDWIDSRKLYTGGEEKALERILDIAIQFAWGLHCVHELGLVHQDVKPANVMIAEDAHAAMQGLKAKVSDYGLARARAAGGERFVPESGQSFLVSSGGYTPAYCSPEQVAGRKLDLRTDVWSWGVSVMEMFQGGVTWHSGRMAAEALEAFLEHNGEEAGIPAMPVEVVELLMGCFSEDPAQRWGNLETVVQKLRTIYQAWVGAVYDRVLDQIESGAFLPPGTVERKTRNGPSWIDPREWLERALREEGHDPTEAQVIMVRQGRTRRGQLVADMATYDEARCMYERLVKRGRKDLAKGLASLCHEAAFVHETVDDSSGALVLFDRGIAIRERLVNVDGKRELSSDLAELYLCKANTFHAMGDHRSASLLYDKAIAILGRLVTVEGRSELADGLAHLYMNKAIALVDLGDIQSALSLFDQSITIFETMVNVEGRREWADSLATVYVNKAGVLRKIGDNRAAAALSILAIDILERLVNIENRRELAGCLAKAYMNKASAVSAMGDNRAVVELYDKAIENYERMVNVEGRGELVDELVHPYMAKARALSALGDHQSASLLYDQATAILERLVNVEGRRELADDLASVSMNKGNELSTIGDYHGAVNLYDRTIEIRERLVNIDGRHELEDELAMVYMNKAVALFHLGDNLESLQLLGRAKNIYERLVKQDGHPEYAVELANVYCNSAEVAKVIGDTYGMMTFFDLAIIINGEKAVALRSLGDNRAAVELFDRAIEVCERLVNVEGRTELADKLAGLYQNKGVTVINLGNNVSAAELFSRAIEIRERLVKVEGQHELAEDLAKLYRNKALALNNLGDIKAAVALYDQAIEILERLVNLDGQRELAEDLDRVYKNKAAAVNKLGEIGLLRPLSLDLFVDNPYRPCPLIIALERGNADEAKRLIAQGADVNQVFTDKGWRRTPLIQAWNKQNEEMIQYLVEHGADINIQDSDGDTALSGAISDGNLKLVKYLLSNDARIDLIKKDGKKVLEIPTSPDVQSYFQLVLQLQAGCKANEIVTVTRPSGDEPIARTTLGHLVDAGFFPGVRQMVENEEGDPNVPDADGVTALILAAHNGYLKLFKYLHEHGGDLSKVDDDGWSPLLYAISNGHVALVNYLLRTSTDIDVAANDGWTPVMIAANRGQFEIVKLLIGAGFQINRFSKKGQCELTVAWPHPEIVKYLAEHGCNPNLTHPIVRKTPLFLIVSTTSSTESVKLLIAAGADVNAKTAEGQTALMVSVANPSMVKTLLDAGADASVKDQDGEDVYDYARKPGASPDVIGILNSHRR